MRGTAKILVFLILILSVSCSMKSNNKKKNVTIGYCDNELKMLIFHDSILNTNYNLFDIRNKTNEKIENIFNDPYCNNLKFNVYYGADSLSSIPMSLNLLYLNDCDFHEFTPKNFCNVLINKKGECLVESEICEIDSLAKRIIDFYTSKVIKEDTTNYYKRVFIAILWDKELEEMNFIKVMNEILNGYFGFVNIRSMTEFEKKLCALNNNELIYIKEKIPFNLRTDFFSGFEKIDFLLPNSPLIQSDSIEIELDVK